MTDCDRLADLLEANSGLLFLAGYDRPGILRKPTVTLHATSGHLSDPEQSHLESMLRERFGNIEVVFALHAAHELGQPASMQSLARMFRHDEIVFDPTGAFRRISSLVAISSRLRKRLGKRVGRVFWQNEQNALVVVVPKTEDEASISEATAHILDEELPRAVRDAVRSIKVVSAEPSGRFVPVDDLSVARPASLFGSTGFQKRLAGMAALISLTAASTAYAAIPPEQSAASVFDPGMSALTGLTTLGENSFGRRNPHQALGGLRLYFGPQAAFLTTERYPAQEPALPAPEPVLSAPEPVLSTPGHDGAQQAELPSAAAPSEQELALLAPVKTPASSGGNGSTNKSSADFPAPVRIAYGA